MFLKLKKYKDGCVQITGSLSDFSENHLFAIAWQKTLIIHKLGGVLNFDTSGINYYITTNLIRTIGEAKIYPPNVFLSPLLGFAINWLNMHYIYNIKQKGKNS